MTYEARELSIAEGEPIELYTFQTSVNVWRYTNIDEEVSISGGTFTSTQIKRLDIEQTQDRSRIPQTITMPGNAAFVLPYRASPPNDVVQVTIQRLHRDDGELNTIWLGRVINVKFNKEGVQADIRCEPVYTSLLRPVLRRLYQRNCPHVLYGTECKVVRTVFETVAQLQGVTGNILSSGTFALVADGYYNGGYVEWSLAGVIQRRFVVAHVGSDVTVSLPFDGILGNADVKIYPGCDHTLDTCVSKFSNELNFGGQPYFPEKNPFGGSPIF